MNADPAELPRAFLTCAARAVAAVAPLLDEAERLLLDNGWRTRLPQRAAPRAGTTLDERRRLRQASYDEVERSAVVLHVPGPPRADGAKLHRELQHAIHHGIPVAVLLALSARRRLGVAEPSPERLEELIAETGATVIEDLASLPMSLEGLRRLPRHHAFPTHHP